MRVVTTEPLREGEALTRDEFERRYAAMPDARAELIEGIVHVASPTKAHHSAAHAVLAGWLFTYVVHTPGIILHDNLSYRLDERNELQPDLVLMLSPARGGRARIDDGGFLVGAPELVVEVAVASAERDLGAKRALYQRAGVQEYLVWEAEAQQLHGWTLHEGRYRPLMPDAEGVWRSQVFPGLWLDVSALARWDLAALLARLEAGLRSPEHTAFCTG